MYQYDKTCFSLLDYFNLYTEKSSLILKVRASICMDCEWIKT